MYYTLVIWGVCVAIACVYAVLKEREELGCYRISIARQCDDANSVYVRGTKMEAGDSAKTLRARMASILSYHEKAGVWRRCLILATALVLVVALLGSWCNATGKWIALHIVITCIIYFYFNYLNYHHFRNLKNNGLEILEKL